MSCINIRCEGEVMECQISIENGLKLFKPINI